MEKGKKENSEGERERERERERKSNEGESALGSLKQKVSRRKHLFIPMKVLMIV